MDFMDHFTHPRNLGVLPTATGVGTSGNPRGGNYLELYLEIRGEQVQKARYLIQGKPQAIIAASITSEWLVGKTISELKEITPGFLRNLLAWPEPLYEPCLELVVGAIQSAVRDHFTGQGWEQDFYTP